MERNISYKRNKILALALAATVLSGCSISSYLTDPSDVQCDGKRTKADLEGDGIATFIVHGAQSDDVASIKVRRVNNLVSLTVGEDVTGPPLVLASDGYTIPTPIVDGAELNAFGAGGSWVIDAQSDSVVIQGSCNGL